MRIFSKFKLNYFNRLVLIINIVILLVAYCVYLNKIFSPTEIPYLNFLSIGFPITFVVVLLFLVYWLFFSWRHFLVIFTLSLGLVYPIYLSYPLIQFNKTDKSDVLFSTLLNRIKG